MKMKVDNFNRAEIFKLFNSRMNPFSFITTKIDVTNIYELCKEKKNIYGTIGFYLTKAMNKVEEFKYIKINEEIYKYDYLSPSYVETLKDGNIGFFLVPFVDDYEEFISNYKKLKNDLLEDKYQQANEDLGEVWLSCLPWFNFSSAIPPFDKDITTPQLIWDKFSFENERVYINLMIMAHHGFVDGSHIGKLIENINEEIKKIKA